MNKLRYWLTISGLVIISLALSLTVVMAQQNTRTPNVEPTPTLQEAKHTLQALLDSVYLPLISDGEENGSLEGKHQDREIICQIPIGDQGIHYEENLNVPPWGPSAFVIGSDQTFWIADAAANRVLQFDKTCNLELIISLDGLATAPTDLAVTTEALWVLDASSQQATILQFSRNGDWIAQYPLPESLSIAEGLSGITLSPQGELLVEQENGAQLHRMVKSSDSTISAAASSYVLEEQSIQVSISGLTSDNPATGYINTGSIEIKISVPNNLGGLRVLGFAQDHSLYAVLEEVALRNTIIVDQRLQHYAPDGTLLGEARSPVQTQYTYVPHALAMDTNGNVYFLVTHPTGVEIRRLDFVTDLEPLIPTLEPTNQIDKLSSMATPEPFVTPAPTPEITFQPSSLDSDDSTLACTITRETIMANAAAFVNNSISLSDTNVNGVCGGRGKPRYLGVAGVYSSVPYDWGGKVSLEIFNTKMREGKQAGDINTAGVEACSVGVDCSGFIARVWNVPAFDATCCENVGTGKLPEYSTQLSSINELQRGDILNNVGSHVALFDRFSDNGNNGFYSYEATTDWNVDRVYKGFRSWTWVANGGYKPYRLKTQYLCTSDADDGRSISLNQTLNGAISQSDDLDPYIFTGTQAQTIEILMARTGNELDSYLNLYNTNGNLLTADDDGAGNRNSLIRVTLPAAGKYRIEAKSYNGGSTGNYQLTVRVGGQLPSAPTNLRTTAVDSSRIQLNWNDNSNNESGFKIYDGGTLIATVGANVVSYTATGLAANSYHCYQIHAYNSLGNSSWTDWSCATTPSSGQPPAAPSNLRAAALDSTRIQLNWNDNSSNEAGFKIYDGGTLVATVGTNTATYIATGLAATSYHCYQVHAYNSYGNSARTAWACATTANASSSNLARGRPAYATSQESSSYPPSQGNDGNSGTRWSSQVSSTLGEQWWWLDLGTQTYDRVIIRWEAAYAASYFVGWSTNGTNYTGYSYTASAAGTYTHSLGTRTARYVGIQMKTRAPRMNNYSFWEAEVYRTSTSAVATGIDGSEQVIENLPVGELETIQFDLTEPEELMNKIYLPLINQ